MLECVITQMSITSLQKRLSRFSITFALHALSEIFKGFRGCLWDWVWSEKSSKRGNYTDFFPLIWKVVNARLALEEIGKISRQSPELMKPFLFNDEIEDDWEECEPGDEDCEEVEIDENGKVTRTELENVFMPIRSFLELLVLFVWTNWMNGRNVLLKMMDVK